MANVLPHAQRQIQNFVMACIAEGKNFEDEPETGVTKSSHKLCALTSDDVDGILNAYERKLNNIENKESEMKPLKHTAMYAQQAWDLAAMRKMKRSDLTTSLAPLPALAFPSSTLEEKHATLGETLQRLSNIHLQTFDCQDAYNRWHNRIFHHTNAIRPTAQQRMVLEAIHARQLNEFHEKHGRPFQSKHYQEP